MVGEKFADLGGVPSEVKEAVAAGDGPVRRIGNIVDDERAGKPVCRCGGEGMVTVVNDAVTGEYLGSSKFDLDPSRRVTESMYPCPSCRPEQFLRWQKGCAAPNHDRKNCPECMGAEERAAAAARAKAKKP